MKNRQLSLIFFLFAELYIYIMQICFNAFINTKILSIVSSALCLIIGLFLFCKTKDYFIMICALFFTLISNISFNLFDNSTVGLVLLNLIQILYFLRTFIESDYKKLSCLTRIVSIPIFLTIGNLLLQERLDILAILWIIYIVNLFLNILFTIKDIGLNNFFPIGLLLLFIHGSLMMFLSLQDYTIVNVPFINFLEELPFDVKDMFYLPAQVVLTCSIFTVNRRCFSKIKKEDN